MKGNATHTDIDFDVLERLFELLTQAQALVIVADCGGLEALREDLFRAYMQALLRMVAEARTIVGEITAEGAA